MRKAQRFGLPLRSFIKTPPSIAVYCNFRPSLSFKLHLAEMLRPFVNVRIAKAALQPPKDRPRSGMGRLQQAGFSAHVKRCGTAFGKEGSSRTFAA